MADANDLRRQLITRAAEARNLGGAEMRDRLQDSASQVHGRQEYFDEDGVSTRTGRMERGVRVTNVDRPPNEFAVDADGDGDNLGYPELVNDGTEPHVITGNPLLRFFWGRAPDVGNLSGGRVVYYERVNHPGTLPSRWYSDVVEQWPEVINEAWDRARSR